MTAHRDDWAGTRAVVRKPPMKETAMRMCGGLEYPGLDRLHNLKGTERILLNGDLMFCSTFDFNELCAAKIVHPTTCVMSLSTSLSGMRRTDS
jgi:hypothetical protein